MQFEETTSEIFPYMLVNIGSGVSIIKVTSNETYERISGTSLGGGTLWGLLGLLTDAKDYDEMLGNFILILVFSFLLIRYRLRNVKDR